jgi:tRNA pseudouridine65 synthase
VRETLPVLYRDERLIAVHKPWGLLVHRSNIDRHETRFALQIVRDQTGRYVLAVHRLDKGTSGVLLFAFDAEAAAILGKAFEAGEIDKRYLAVVRGWTEESGVIDHPLSAVADDYAGRAADAAAQAATTRYRTLARAELPHRVDRYPTSRYALIELDPLTGRQHQIRRHLKHIFHPIIGDATYGTGRHNRLFASLFGVQRLLLCCTRMAFLHPSTRERVFVEAEPSEDFTTVLRELGWEKHWDGRTGGSS